MNLAYKKILGKFTKVLGFGKTPPPHVGKISQIISFFLPIFLPIKIFFLVSFSGRKLILKLIFVLDFVIESLTSFGLIKLESVGKVKLLNGAVSQFPRNLLILHCIQNMRFEI